jgi:hypothetical protein
LAIWSIVVSHIKKQVSFIRTIVRYSLVVFLFSLVTFNILVDISLDLGFDVVTWSILVIFVAPIRKGARFSEQTMRWKLILPFCILILFPLIADAVLLAETGRLALSSSYRVAEWCIRRFGATKEISTRRPL